MEESELEKKAEEYLSFKESLNFGLKDSKNKILDYYNDLPMELKDYINKNNKYNWILKEAKFRF